MFEDAFSPSPESARVLGQISGYSIVQGIRELANSYGLICSFRVYLDVVKQQCPNFPVLRGELYSSGVSIMDCPSTSKDVIDKAIIGKLSVFPNTDCQPGLIVIQVDMFNLAMDEQPPRTILVATGDQDLSHALAVLRLRGFKIILVYPTGTQECLLMQSDESFNWHSQIFGRSSGRVDLSPSSFSSSPLSSPSPSGHAEIYCTTTSLVNGIHSSTGACSAQAGSLKPATSRSHHMDSSLHVSFSTDARLGRSNEGDGADLSLAALPAPPVPHASLPSASPRRSRTPSGTTKSNTKAQASAFSDGWFPPPPSFPLDTPPPGSPTATSRDDKITVVSPLPPGNPMIIDHSNLEPDSKEALAGSEPLITPSSIQPVQEPVGSSSSTINPAVPDTVLSATHSPDTLAPESAKMITPSQRHVANHAGSSAGGVLTSLGTPVTLHRVNSPNSTLPATTKSQPTVSSAHPIPAASALTSAARNPSGSVLSSLKPQPSSPAKPSTKLVPLQFRPLVQVLQQLGGTAGIEQGQISSKIVQLNPRVYADAGVSKWKSYVKRAVKVGIISKDGDIISLSNGWLNSKINP